MRLLSFLLALSSTLVLHAPAAASDYSGRVRAVACHTIASVCLVQLDGVHAGPGCVQGTAAWKYAFDGTTTVGKNILSILLIAQATKSSVTIGGLDACTVAAGSEDLRHAYMVP